MRFLRTLIVSALLSAFVPPAMSQTAGQVSAQPREARFGFVIGNDDYEGAPLATAANDAALVADALKSAGFDVTGARNLDAETFRAAYREFLEKVQAAGPGAVAAIYVSGYGLQSDGENYLVPSGARVARDADLALNGVRLSDLMRPLDGLQNRAKITLFDLAYAGPFIKENPPPQGLALIDPDRGSLVGYNAGPGEVAPLPKLPYGPYAQALAEMLRQPGLDMNEIMVRVRGRVAELSGGAQVPWHVSKIEPPLVLLERGADAPAPQVAPEAVAARRQRPLRDLSPDEAYAAALERDTPAGYEEFLVAFPSSPYARNVRGMLAARREAAVWRRSLIVNSPQAYWSYMRRYPRGPHVSEARRRLARLSVAAEPPPDFAEIPYDLGPPPPEELAYFDAPRPLYFDAGVPPPPPAVFMAPPPQWWRPPPPPVFADDADYYLAEPEFVPAPAWVQPPVYVAAPPAPIIYEDRPRGSIVPYVAIPAALAVGIVAGRIINRQGRRPGLGMPPSGPGGAGPGGAGPGAGPGRPFLPPVAAPANAVRPGALQTIRLQPGTGAPVRPAPVQMQGGVQQLLTRPGMPGQTTVPRTGAPGIGAPGLGAPGQGPGQLGRSPGQPSVTAPPTAPTTLPSIETSRPGNLPAGGQRPPLPAGATLPPPNMVAPNPAATRQMQMQQQRQQIEQTRQLQQQQRQMQQQQEREQRLQGEQARQQQRLLEQQQRLQRQGGDKQRLQQRQQEQLQDQQQRQLRQQQQQQIQQQRQQERMRDQQQRLQRQQMDDSRREQMQRQMQMQQQRQQQQQQMQQRQQMQQQQRTMQQQQQMQRQQQQQMQQQRQQQQRIIQQQQQLQKQMQRR